MASVTLLPGLACDAGQWHAQIPALRAAGHRVAVSDVHSRCATLPEMAAALLAEHDGPLTLIGTSMGGMLAFEVLRQAPQRVAALALLGCTARPDTPELLQLRSEAVSRFARGEAADVLRENLTFAIHPSRIDDAQLIARYFDLVLGAGAEQLIAQNRAVMLRPDSRPLLHGIACPTLVVVGDADALTPLEHAQEIAAAIPNARFEIIECCGHLITLERPERVNALLLGWLETLPHPA
jgi:pimeloyl-ACP methyl ester carboxylesterase